MAFEETPAPRREISVRRAPRYVPFMVLGAILGFVGAGFVAFVLPADGEYDANAVFGFFLIAFGIAGIILGSVVALILDRISLKKAQTAVVEAVSDAEPDDDATRISGS
ncbi:hypothetical protein [Pseudarthrobacter sp. PS3-L1]|uniref:hypothetical protein n=1 Tax=Pseudarthrobacter sp. PS3-L1 TaxID=3046207 RepID=UPI0024BA156A|nr:hypothetical protein [Pseudarthrobacter sp. PS3-L1]MDJ0319143.1 hypothetical protein [Pseudarthrobacter sp. PS3-L1]